MDLYFRKQDEFQLHFNCNFYSVSDIPLNEKRHPILGAFLIILFVVFECLYLPCLFAMLSKQLRKNFCYKLMIIMTIYDMLLLFENALYPGYASIHGYMPCDMPIFSYFLGITLVALWIGYSVTSVTLALNRCLAFSQYSTLFTGKKEYFWLTLPIIITLLVFVFGRPGFFSSVQCAYFFSPHFDYFDDPQNYYPWKFHAFNNISFSIVVPLIYLIYFLMNYFLSKQRTRGMSKREYSLFLQVLFVNITIALASFSYVVFQFVHLPKSLVFISHISWVLIEGAPPLVYLCLNKTVQRIILDAMRRGNKVTITIDSQPMESQQRNSNIPSVM